MSGPYDMDGEEVGGKVAPYDASDEQRPDNVVYRQEYADLKAMIAKAAEDLRAPLDKTDYMNAIVTTLQDEIARRIKEDNPGDVMFAVTGDMESGKSSVINSILGQGMIAKKGDSGASCTWVVQRFMKTFPDQGSPFAAKVYFFEQNEIRGIIKAHLAKYYNAFQKNASNSDGTETQEDRDEDYSEKRTVLEAFMPLFGAYEEFESEENAMAYLDHATSEDDANILDELNAWAIESIDFQLDGEDCHKIEASTSSELLRKLEQFTSTLKDGTGDGLCQPWLLVRVVDFGLDIPILNDGIIFVDSPGTSDANTTRAANARIFHRKCSHKIHVAKVGRAKDDKSLREAMTQAHRSHGSGNTILVLTHGDEVDGDSMLSGPPKLKQHEAKLRNQIEELRKRKSEVRAKRQKRNRDQIFDAENEMEHVEAELQRATREHKLIRLRLRNDNTKTAIQSQYKQQSGDAHPLPIFVIANEEYRQHQAGFYDWDKPMLDVEDTGVPALRKQIYTLPAEGRLNETIHVALHQLPGLLNSIDLYCAKTHLDRQHELKAIMETPSTKIQLIIDDLFAAMQQKVRVNVLQPMLDDEDEWVRAASKLARNWGVMYKTSFLRMMRSQGFKKGRRKADEDICWNTELTQIMEDKLREYFSNAMDVFKECYNAIWDQVFAMFNDCKKAIKSNKQFGFVGTQPLVESLDHERANAKKHWDTSLRNLRKALSHIESATLTSPSDGYLADVMLPIYTEISLIKGKNAVMTRIETLKQKLYERSNVWTGVHDRILGGFESAFLEHLKDLRIQLRITTKALSNTLELMCTNTVAKTEAEKEQEAELIGELSKASIKVTEQVKGPLHDLAIKCRDYAKTAEASALFISSN